MTAKWVSLRGAKRRSNLGEQVLQAEELGGLLPGGADAASVEIGAGLGEPGETEAGFLDHVDPRPIGAIDPAELAAEQPFALPELARHDGEPPRHRPSPPCNDG